MTIEKTFPSNLYGGKIGADCIFDIKKYHDTFGVGSNQNNSDDGDGDLGIGVATKVRTKTKRPSLYRVLLLNDDFTPQEFVVVVLMDIFNKTSDEAQKIMMHVHMNGVGECGVFPYEVAETKVMLVMDAAQKSQHPLQCVMEKK
ncbi:MAG: ATP-dependent Clp protease adapter ClpS [Devosiaceae bacterium]|nr:ATP-dependent Clp protease adapter ClpS [Devosiaceae bacterium]